MCMELTWNQGTKKPRNLLGKNNIYTEKKAEVKISALEEKFLRDMKLLNMV